MKIQLNDIPDLEELIRCADDLANSMLNDRVDSIGSLGRRMKKVEAYRKARGKAGL